MHVTDDKDGVNRQILLNSQFNVIQLSDFCLGFDMCCVLTPIILAQLLLACLPKPDP